MDRVIKRVGGPMRKVIIPKDIDEEQSSLVREALNREVQPGKVLWVSEEEAEKLKAILGDQVLESMNG